MTNKHTHAGHHLVLVSGLLVIGLAGILGFFAYTTWQKGVSDAGNISTVGRPAGSTVINAGTYNVRSQRWDGTNNTYEPWHIRKAKVAALVRKSKASIIGMQEVLGYNPETKKTSPQRNDVVQFMKKLGYKAYLGKTNNSSPIFWKKKVYTKASTASTLLFNPSTSKRSSVPAARYINYVRLQHTETGRYISVLNYHFNQWEQTKPQLKKLGIAAKNAQAAYPYDPMIFTGDFNGYQHKVIAAMKTKGVTMHITDGHEGIDHVLARTTVKKHTWKNLGGTPKASDHPLIVATLGL